MLDNTCLVKYHKYHASERGKLCIMAPKKILTVAELTSRAGKIGGKARMKSLSADERKELARQGGRAGGRARADALSAGQRSDIARKAALTRWSKKKKKTGPATA
jgi:hypothetical protein